MQAQEVRVVDETGKQIGILPLSDAKRIAQEADLDLVEIAPDAKPPVVKVIDFKKFKYLETKKEKEARKKTKETELKEVRVTPFIGEHDLNTALEKTKKFLGAGDLVKISVVFTGRQMAHQEFGYKLLERIMQILPEAEKERPERFEGRRLVTVIRGVKGSKNPAKGEARPNEQQNANVQNQNVDTSTP